jgi:uncharacterized integral membrane protein
MRIFYTIVIAVIVLFIISFSLQNAPEVPLKYYDMFNVTLPAYMLMFIAFLVGVIFTGLMGFAERLNMTRTIRQLNKTVRDLRRELRAQENVSDKEETVDDLDYIEP